MYYCCADSACGSGPFKHTECPRCGSRCVPSELSPRIESYLKLCGKPDGMRDSNGVIDLLWNGTGGRSAEVRFCSNGSFIVTLCIGSTTQVLSHFREDDKSSIHAIQAFLYGE